MSVVRVFERTVSHVLSTLVVVKPETVIRWHRAGFRLFWRWKSRARRQTEGPARNPPIDPRHEPRQPVLGRSANPRRTPQTRHRCGSDLGCQYMARHRRLPSQGWKTFLRNHADGVAAMDLFVVPTLSFRPL